MQSPNFTDSLATVIFTLSAFEDMCRDAMPRTNVIFDQQLSYDTAAEGLMNRNNFNQLSEMNKPDSLFIYSRTAIEDSEQGSGRRLTQRQSVITDSNGDKLKLKPVSGEFDINFLFTAHQVEDVYNFETFYAANLGFGPKELVTNIPEIGEFSYYLKYLPLTDIQTLSSRPDMSFKTVGGTIRARGIFFVVTGSNNSIAKLRLRLFDKKDPLIDSILLDQWNKP